MNSKIAVFVDLFGKTPDAKPAKRSKKEIDSIKYRIDEMFKIREQTKRTDFEPVFILYHRSDAIKEASSYLDSAVIHRLSHYHTLHSDLNDQKLRLALRSVWNAVQKDFLTADLIQSISQR